MSLDDLRQQIDDADREIIAALKRRAEIAREIGRAKAEEGSPAFAPDRETEVLRRVRATEAGPLSPANLQAIFVEIMSACRALEEPLRVAYLGPEFTFSHQAVLARFGRSCEPVSQFTVHDALAAVAAGQADLALVPAENSTEGPIGETFDSLVLGDLTVTGEFYLPVTHTLLGRGRLEAIEAVYSHPQVLAQCRRWLRENLPGAQFVPASSSAAAAALAAESEVRAAIAPAEAGQAHGLRVLADGIQDDPWNRTRFWIVGGPKPLPTGHDKTSVVFSTPHRAGTLHAALQPFRDFGANMTMIHSRPLPGRSWEYFFFIDFQGHTDEPGSSQVVEALRELCPMVKVLGSYPEAD
jgi:chorismate mutase / prephenate dehydratase